MTHLSNIHRSCPLCGAGENQVLGSVLERIYHACSCCGLVYLGEGVFPTPEEELERYRLHENSHEQSGYLEFLMRLLFPLCERLSEGQRGLDYGSGPQPVAAELMEEKGFSVSCYDPFFSNDRSVFSLQFDFLYCIETAEHFHVPRQEFDRIAGMLKPGALFGLMTKLYDGDCAFEDWYYAKDPTHVSFYAEQTLIWLGRHYGWEAIYRGGNAVIFRNHPEAP